MSELSLELKNRLKEIAKVVVDSNGSENIAELFKDLEITADLMPEIKAELDKQIKIYMLSKVKISVGGYTGKKAETVLTASEEKAIQYIKKEFEINGIDFNKTVRFERKSDRYLTLLAPNDIDFCRIKAGSLSVWFSVDTWKLDDDKKLDIRFAEVKKRSVRHWKVNLNCIDDFKNNSDLIVDSYKSLNI